MAADGSITAVIKFDINDAEKRIETLKKQIIKLEDRINVNKGKKIALTEQLDETKAALKELNKETSYVGDKFITSPENIKKMQKLKEEIKRIEAEIEKCDIQSKNWNAELEGTKRAYGEAEKEANKLRETQKEITKDSGKTGESSGGIGEEQVRETRKYIQEATAAIKQMMESIPVIAEKIHPGINAAFEKIKGKAEETVSNIVNTAKEKLPSGVTSGVEEAVASIKRIFDYLGEKLGPEMQEIVNSFNRVIDHFAQGDIDTSGYDDITEAAQGAEEELELLDDELQQKPRDAEKASEALQFMGRISDFLSNALEGARSALSGFAKICATAVKKAARSIVTLGKSVLSAASNMNALTKLSEKLSGVFNRLGSMIRRVFVYSVLTSFFRAVRKQITEYLSLNAEFMTALGRLKSALATAFQPILSTVIPILTNLINVLTRVISVMAQFIASIFGTTAAKAQANAKALNEQAKATEAAGSAAKEASKQMANFDEINQLSGGSSGSGGGGGMDAVEAGQALFDLDLDDTVLKSWGEAFDAFLQHILDEGIPSLQKGLSNFANWLNWFSANLLEMFTFPGVKEKVIAIGEQVADALNEAAGMVDWKRFGSALGAGLNLAINLLNSFFKTIRFDEIGKHLSGLVNGVVNMVDWKGFGQLLWSGFKISFETLAGLFQGLNMPEIAKAASDIAIGFFDSITETLNKIQWSEIGAQIARFLQNVDWVGIFQSVYNTIKAALDALQDLITGFLAEFGTGTQPLIDIVNTIFDTIKKLMDMTVEWAQTIDLGPLADAFHYLADAVSNLVSVVSDGLMWAYQNVLLPLAGWVIEESGPKMVNLLAAAIDLLAAVLAKLQPVAEWFWENFIQPIAAFAWDIISTGIDGITNAVGKLTDLLNGNMSFKEFLDTISPGEAIILGIIAVLGTAATIFGVVTAAVAAFNAIGQACALIIAALTSPIGLVVAAIAGLTAGFVALYQHSETFRNFVDGIINWAKEIIPGIISGIQEGWENLKTYLSGLWQMMLDGFKSFFGISSPSTVMAEQGGYLVEGLKQGLSNLWESISGIFTTALNNIKSTFSLENLKSIGKNMVTGLFNGLDNAKTKMKDWGSNILTSVKNVFGIHSPSTEFESFGDYMMKGMFEGLDSNFNRIMGLFKDLLSTVDNMFQTSTAQIVSLIENATREIVSLLNNATDTLLSLFTVTFTALSTLCKETTEELVSLFTAAFTEITTLCTESANVLLVTFAATFNAIATLCNENTTKMREYLSTFMTYMTSDFASKWSKTWSDFYTVSNKNINSVISSVNALNSALASIERKITITITTIEKTVTQSSASSDSSGTSNASARTLSVPQGVRLNLPALATGAVIPPNREFAAILGDQKSGYNYEVPDSKLRQLMREELSRFMGSGSNEATIEVDGQVFGRLVYKYSNRESKRVGANFVVSGV